MFLIFRSLPLVADSRTSRNLEIYKTVDANTVASTWEISGQNPYSFPLTKSGNKITRLLKFLAFVSWVPLKVFKHRKELTGVCFMDLETAVLGIPLARLLRLKTVFDIVDPLAQTKLSNSKLVDHLELYIASLASFVTIPHQSRISYYSDRLGRELTSNYLVIENVPDFGIKRATTAIREQSSSSAGPKETDITIGYFGTLDKRTRGLEELVKQAELNRNINLTIGGAGALSDYFESYDGPAKINYIGRFKHSDLVKLLNEIDFNWAYYCPSIELHRYAAPNKFYEHLYFKKPIIVSDIIPQASFVDTKKTGIVIANIAEIDLYRECRYILEKIDWKTDHWAQNYEEYWDKIKEQIRDICERDESRTN